MVGKPSHVQPDRHGVTVSPAFWDSAEIIYTGNSHQRWKLSTMYAMKQRPKKTDRFREIQVSAWFIRLYIAQQDCHEA